MHGIRKMNNYIQLGYQKAKICSVAVAIILLFWVPYATAEPLTVNTNIANVRSGPGTKYDVIWKVEKYRSFIAAQPRSCLRPGSTRRARQAAPAWRSA